MSQSQANQWEETQYTNNHTTARTKSKLSNQLSISQRSDRKTRKGPLAAKYCITLQYTDQKIYPH